MMYARAPVLFADMLRLIAELRPPPIQCARDAFGRDGFMPFPGEPDARRADVTGFGVLEHHRSAAISTSTSG